jgi:hypothetical protein
MISPGRSVELLVKGSCIAINLQHYGSPERRLPHEMETAFLAGVATQQPHEGFETTGSSCQKCARGAIMNLSAWLSVA